VAVVRLPVITEDDLGPAGWHELHELARRRGRKRARDQVLPLLQWALAESLAGQDVEPRRHHLEALFAEPELEAEAVG
jgi:hypothetical protein